MSAGSPTADRAGRRLRAIRSVPVVAGLLVVAAIAIIVIDSGGAGTEVTAEFDQVYGLIPGARVDAGGVQIGEVTGISLAADGYPLVRMQVDASFELREGASAQLATPSASGEVNRVVELRSGSGAPLGSGATIPRSRTTEPQEFDQVLSTFDPQTRSEVRDLLARLDGATAGRGPQIAATLIGSGQALRATADVIQELNADTGALQALIDRAGEVTGALEQHPGALGRMTDQLSQLLTSTAARQQQLDEIVQAAPSGLRSGVAALQRVNASVPTLRRLVSDATPGIAELRAVAPNLQAFLVSARPAVRQLGLLVDAAPAQLRAIQPLLGTALLVVRAATPALTQLIPIANQLRARPDAFSFFVNWSEFFNDYDANGYGGRTGLVFANPPSDSVGSADAKPGMLAPPFLRDPGVLAGEPWSNYRKSFIGPGQ